MDKKTLKIKTLIWISMVVLVATVIYIFFDFVYSVIYKFDIDHVAMTYLIYFTHVSTLSSAMWIFLLTFSRIGKKTKMDNFLTSWLIRTPILMFILVTGTLFMVVAFIPVALFYSNPNSIILDNVGNEFLEAGFFYRFMCILSALLKHFLIPIVMFIVAFKEGNSSKFENGFTNYEKSMRILILPFLYLILALFFISLGSPSPYPFFDFENMIEINQLDNISLIKISTIEIIISMILIIFIGIYCILVSWLILERSNLNNTRLSTNITHKILN